MEVLHSQIIGEGTELIILHGFLGMADNWRTPGKMLAQMDYRVHLVDQRNHGRSFWSDDFSYEDMSDDLLLYMEHHGLDNALLLGHSMGGKTAMTFATDHPEMCSKLIVTDIAPRYYPPHHQNVIEALQTLDLETINDRKEAEEMITHFIEAPAMRKWLLKNLYWERPEKLGFRCNLKVLADSMEEIGEPISGTALFEGSALFIRGDRSEYVQEADISIIKRHFPKAEVVTVPDAGHWVHAENPVGFMNALIPFLKEG